MELMSTSNNGAKSPTLKKRKEKRFNLLDVLIIIAALLAIATVFYVFTPFSRLETAVKKQTKNIHYTIEILGVDEAFLQNIKENQMVIDSVTKNQLGTVTAVDYHTKYTELQYVVKDGKASGVLAEYPDRYNVLVTINATADYLAEEGYSVNHRRIAVGERMTLRFPDYTCEAYCIGLNPS